MTERRARALLRLPTAAPSGSGSTLPPGPSCRRTPLKSSRQQQKQQKQLAAAGSAPAVDASPWRAPPAATRCQRRACSRCAPAAARRATATSRPEAALARAQARVQAGGGSGRSCRRGGGQRGRAGRRARSLAQTLCAESKGVGGPAPRTHPGVGAPTWVGWGRSCSLGKAWPLDEEVTGCTVGLVINSLSMCGEPV